LILASSVLSIAADRKQIVEYLYHFLRRNAMLGDLIDVVIVKLKLTDADS